MPIPRFSLIHNNQPIRNLNELRQECDIEQLWIDYQDGRLLKWLKQDNNTDEKQLLIFAIEQIPNQIESINQNSSYVDLRIVQKLSRILGIDEQKLEVYQQFQQFYQEGNNYYESQEYDKALASYRQALAIKPHHQELIKKKEATERKIAEIAQQKAEEEKKNRLTEDLGNGVILELVEIPAGSFMMGSNDYDTEKPIHRISINYTFLMGKYPVTQAQYQAIMGNNPSYFKGDNRPVESVSWDMAQQFCQKLSAKTGGTFRLPSEAEWEYACRGGSETKYYFGDDQNQLDNYAWYSNNSNSQTHPVGQKKPNNWGLYDMLGNVWEWCEDDYIANYNKTPTDGTPYIKSNMMYKCLRGGSWLNGCNRCRCAWRYWGRRMNPDFFSDYYGFRLVCGFPETTY